MSRSKVDVYSRDAYCFCEGKSHKPHRDRTPQARLQRLAVRFLHNHGQTVNRVAGILLLHTSPAPGLSIPHVIILREEVKTCSEEVGTTNNSYFSLPGGRCRDLEDDRTCLQRKLHTLLGVLSVVPSEPEPGRLVTQTVPAAACSATLNNLHMSAEMSTPFAPNSRKRSHSETEGYSDLFNADDTTNKTRKGKVLLEQEKHLEREESVPKIPSSGFAPHAPASDAFIIGELITEWFRPACENLMYPYIPPHCTKPMEVCRVYMIHAPSNYTFTIPQNRHILAVPTYELYDNQTVYNSALLASLPQCISRYQMNFV